MVDFMQKLKNSQVQLYSLLVGFTKKKHVALK